MKLFAILAALVLPLFGQSPAVTLTGPSTVTAGGTVTATITLTGSTGQNVAALQWTLGLTSGVSLGTPTAASAWSTAGDFVTCNPANGTCVEVGSQTAMGDGVTASLPLTFSATLAPGTVTIPLSGLFGASTAGTSVNGITSGPAFSIKVLSRCDLNQDGAVNLADVQLMVNDLLGISACPVGLTCSLVGAEQIVIAANGGACKL